MTKPQVFTSISLCSLMIGALLVTSPPTRAASHLKQYTFHLAQSNSRGCRAEESTFVATETANYRIYICGGDNPETYVGIEKQNPSHSIRLQLTDYDPQGNFFEATNGDISYILAKTPRGMYLTVSQGYQELLRESVLRPW
jgi:hypothetical protein